MYDPTMTLREEDYIEYLALRHYDRFSGSETMCNMRSISALNCSICNMDLSLTFKRDAAIKMNKEK